MTSPNPMALEAKALEAADTAAVDAVAEVFWTDFHGRMGGPWPGIRNMNYISVAQTVATAIAAIRAYLDALPLPAAGEGLEASALEAMRATMSECLGSDEFTASVWSAAQVGLHSYLTSLAGERSGETDRVHAAADANATPASPAGEGLEPVMWRWRWGKLGSNTGWYFSFVKPGPFPEEGYEVQPLYASTPAARAAVLPPESATV